MHKKAGRKLTWLEGDDQFPPVNTAWGEHDPVPGLLAAGGSLDVSTLVRAYAQGIFPWFSEGQPILWWSPDPRMVLQTKNFRLHRSLRKTLQRFTQDASCEIRVDTAFDDVIKACANKSREGQAGTWILPDMVEAYRALHRAGYAHSVETRIHGELAGGLYCVNTGRAVFGESMFAHATDASKIALAALLSFCRRNNIEVIDCQQNTAHLASLGAREISRDSFVQLVDENAGKQAPIWRFEPVYWTEILTVSTTTPT